jgi:heme exporter protein B
MTGLSRVFVKEEEAQTSNTLRLATDSGAVFAGKLLFNLVLMALLDLLVAPLFLLVMDFELAQPWMFAGVIALGSLGLVCATTLVAGIIGKAQVQGGLFAVLAFPAVFPILMVAVRGCEKAASGAAAPLAEMQMLFSMAGLLTVVSAFLFPHVWES